MKHDKCININKLGISKIEEEIKISGEINNNKEIINYDNKIYNSNIVLNEYVAEYDTLKQIMNDFKLSKNEKITKINEICDIIKFPISIIIIKEKIIIEIN